MAEYDARNDGSIESDVLVIDQTPFEATQTLTRPDGETMTREVVQQTCLDGCGGVPTGKKSRFIQGHDATLKGRLIRAHINAVPVAIVVNGQRNEMSALEYAADLNWDRFLVEATAREEDKRQRIQARKEDMERLRTEREAKKDAAVRTDEEFPLFLKLFGREFPARVLSEETDGSVVYEYRKKDGSTNTHVIKPEPQATVTTPAASTSAAGPTTPPPDPDPVDPEDEDENGEDED